MTIRLNGDQVAVDGTVRDLVSLRFGADAGKGIAVAVNGVVVVRSAWEDTALLDGDRVEIVTAVQGG
jgi:sulfur carrier protein